MRWNTCAWNWRLKRKNHENTSSRKYLVDLVPVVFSMERTGAPLPTAGSGVPGVTWGSSRKVKCSIPNSQYITRRQLNSGGGSLVKLLTKPGYTIKTGDACSTPTLHEPLHNTCNIDTLTSSTQAGRLHLPRRIKFDKYDLVWAHIVAEIVITPFSHIRCLGKGQ